MPLDQPHRQLTSARNNRDQVQLLTTAVPVLHARKAARVLQRAGHRSATHLSMSPMMELYSWQEKSAFYKMTLDVEDIGKDRANSVELPDPIFSTDLPSEVASLFTEAMV